MNPIQLRQFLCDLYNTAVVAVSADKCLPAYLPQPLAEALPAFQKLPVRALAELRLRADEREAHPLALRLVALARIEPFPTL